jgi:signal transduction histidine kinase/CHASE3 domain sensor protein/FixJ family two-component response regulator
MKVSASKLAHVSFWLATLVMVVMGWTLYGAARSERESSARVGHTQEVRQTLAEINSLASRVESAQRGYLLSGSAAFLSERDQAFEKMNDAIGDVKKLTGDSPTQQNRISQLENLVAARIALMKEGARLRSVAGIEASRLRADSGVGQEASGRIHDLIAELKQEELRLLKLHRADAAYRHSIEMFILVAGVIFGALVLIPGYLGFVLQSRARKRMEMMLRAMADSLPGALYQLRHDAQGKTRFTFMSAGVTNVSGVGAACAAGTLPDWGAMVNDIDERDRVQFVAALAEATKSLSPFRHDYRVMHGDGDLRCLHHEASLQRDRDGSILQNGYVADVSEQRRLEDALQEAKGTAESASLAKSAFLATMSHEIRTPMNGALGMLELLSLTKLDGEQRTTLEIVRESGRSLLRIIDDILDFSRIEAGKLNVCPEATSLREVVEDMYDLYSGNASSKGLLIGRSVDPRISPAVRVDPLRLRQILGNFVSNALKFTSRGRIDISAELIGRADAHDRVRFSVQDTGIGISAENQQRLFQPFSQVDGGAAAQAGSSGLGLMICRRLAGLMGGSIEMVSAPGNGTRMVLELSLPIADAADLPKSDREKARDLLRNAMSMRRIAPDAAQAESEGTLVLVVDDHPTNRTLLERQARALGYASESAEDGAEALEKWKSGRFGIVITDCDMPEMDGYALARAIRALESGNGRKRTPIIACTANALGGETEICMAAGMDDHLVKPVELSKILEKLDRWLPIPLSAPVASAAAAAAPLDLSVLARISGGDAAIERDVIADFRLANDEDAAMLMRAVATSDMRQVMRATHRMLGASRTVGAVGFARVCERIEHASRASDWPAVAASMEAFHQEWTRLNSYSDSI